MRKINMKKITILTRPVSIYAFLTKAIRNSLRFSRTFIKTGVVDLDIFIYYGHTAVTKSLVYGMRDNMAEFNFNPFTTESIGNTVIVLNDVQALKQAIQWKKERRIKALLAGPNIVELPTKYNNLILSPEIDLVIVPSEMTVSIYKKLNPCLSGKVVSWYAGVDTAYWRPRNLPEKKGKEVIVYWKNAPKAFSLEVELILKHKGYKINRVIYGHYSKARFKRLLERSVFAVFLSISETQGIALAESWAMNVPSIVWDPEIEHYYLRGIQTSAAPYLSKDTGIRWRELEDLELLLSNASLLLEKFSPRDWVMKNMSNKVSSEMLIQICKDINNK